ncbi:MAG: hypothetical protein RLN99_13655, partial [Kiloniellaceae bacterium]
MQSRTCARQRAKRLQRKARGAAFGLAVLIGAATFAAPLAAQVLQAQDLRPSGLQTTSQPGYQSHATLPAADDQLPLAGPDGLPAVLSAGDAE